MPDNKNFGNQQDKNKDMNQPQQDGKIGQGQNQGVPNQERKNDRNPDDRLGATEKQGK